MADDLDRIEVARRPAPAILAPRRPSDQRRAGAEKVDDLGQRLRVPRQNEGKRNSGQIRWVTSRTPDRSGEVARSDRSK